MGYDTSGLFVEDQSPRLAYAPIQRTLHVHVRARQLPIFYAMLLYICISPLVHRHVLEPFDTTLLKAHYCYRLKPSLPQNKTLFEITSEESFFLFQLFYSNHYRSLLPPLNETTIADLSLHFLKVYAGLWCCPLHETVAAADWLIHNHLHNSLRYVSVHKRQMEGGCSKTMAGVTQPADFSPRDLPMQRREWRGPLASSHPLCEMPLPFLRDTMDMHHRNCSDIFVAWDGRGDVSSYRREGAVFSDMLDTTLANHRDVNLKFVDMFLAIHSDLFLLNPRSTFSWQIYLVRVCLGLFSVPVVRGNDLYLQRVPDELGMSLPPQPPHLEGDASLPLPPLPKIRPLWVSWTSVIDAYTAEVDSAVGKEWLP